MLNYIGTSLSSLDFDQALLSIHYPKRRLCRCRSFYRVLFLGTAKSLFVAEQTHGKHLAHGKQYICYSSERIHRANIRHTTNLSYLPCAKRQAHNKLPTSNDGVFLCRGRSLAHDKSFAVCSEKEPMVNIILPADVYRVLFAVCGTK